MLQAELSGGHWHGSPRTLQRAARVRTANQYHIKILCKVRAQQNRTVRRAVHDAGRCVPRDYHSALQEPVLQRTKIVPRYTAAGVMYCAPHSAILLGTDLTVDFYMILIRCADPRGALQRARAAMPVAAA